MLSQKRKIDDLPHKTAIIKIHYKRHSDIIIIVMCSYGSIGTLSRNGKMKEEKKKVGKGG